MKLKPIRSDRELDRALKRIEELWGAKPGTSRGDELDVLMLLVEKYEDEHFPIPASDPHVSSFGAGRTAMDGRGR